MPSVRSRLRRAGVAGSAAADHRQARRVLDAGPAAGADAAHRGGGGALALLSDHRGTGAFAGRGGAAGALRQGRADAGGPFRSGVPADRRGAGAHHRRQVVGHAGTGGRTGGSRTRLPSRADLRTTVQAPGCTNRAGFFAPHRDTEKVDGMVATLVVALPVAGRRRRVGHPPRRAGGRRRPGHRRALRARPSPPSTRIASTKFAR